MKIGFAGCLTLNPEATELLFLSDCLSQGYPALEFLNSGALWVDLGLAMGIGLKHGGRGILLRWFYLRYHNEDL